MSNNIDTNISSEQDADLLSDRPSRKPAAIPFGLNPDADLLTNKPTPDTSHQRAKAAIIKRDKEEPERIWSFTELCEEWIYVTQMDRFVCLTDRDLILKTEQFDKRFAYAKPDSTKLKSISAFMFSKIRGTIRRPMRSVYLPGELNGMFGANWNAAKPSNIEPAPGDTTLWDEHLKYLFPNKEDRGHVLNWCAWLLQNLALKPKHALLLAGHVQGTGKSFIGDVLTQIIGPDNVSPVGTIELSSSFNKWALGSKLLLIEELDAVDRNVIRHKLHPMITQERLTINDKGIQTYAIDNCFGVLGFTNEDAAIRLTKQDRRYLVVRTYAEPRDPKYYVDLYAILKNQKALGAIAHQLWVHDVGDYNAQGRAPETAAKRDMVDAGRGDLEAWLHDHIDCFPDIVTIEYIVDMLPLSLQPRHGNSGVRRAIRQFIQYELKGEQPAEALYVAEKIRPRIWVLHGKLKEFEAMQNAERVALYLEGLETPNALAITDQRNEARAWAVCRGPANEFTEESDEHLLS